MERHPGQNGETVSLAGITALVLAGGLGSRLRSVVSDRPKVLAMVHGRPFLAFLLDQLVAAGVQQTVLCTGYCGDQVAAEFGDHYAGMSLTWSREPLPLGTGGALRAALRFAESPCVLALNGDSYCAADLAEFYCWHRSRGHRGSLLLTQMADTSRFGRVQVEPPGLVRCFEEKRAAAGPGWINAGVYLFDTQLLAELPDNRPSSLERDGLTRWADGRLGGFCVEAPFLDIGTPESYARTESFFDGCRTSQAAR